MRKMIDDGFVQREYQEDLDGYMDKQLKESDVPGLDTAFSMIALFDEVNRLRREVLHLNKLLEIKK